MCYLQPKLGAAENVAFTSLVVYLILHLPTLKYDQAIPNEGFLWQCYSFGLKGITFCSFFLLDEIRNYLILEKHELKCGTKLAITPSNNILMIICASFPIYFTKRYTSNNNKNSFPSKSTSHGSHFILSTWKSTNWLLNLFVKSICLHVRLYRHKSLGQLGWSICPIPLSLTHTHIHTYIHPYMHNSKY